MNFWSYTDREFVQIEILVMYRQRVCAINWKLDAFKVGNSRFIAHKTKENTRFGMVVVKQRKNYVILIFD